MIRITKIFTFETAHVLYNYDGKCKNMHGHSYKLFVTVKGTPIDDLDHPKNGMVVDFGDIKKIVKSEIIDVWDHAVLVNGASPHKDLGSDLETKGHKVIFCDYQPTCENMLYDIAEKIKKRLTGDVSLAYLKLHETENSYGEWFAEDQVGFR
ncbi:6-pyruvoyl trahydropterin synthase family protein [Kaistella rhinocerotis]|uniref:6-pyruvoyl trahydropterin synthase family protein n=1 Tax=Kaistella rhinocerotis TaxID=3026437 RepID=UPI00255547FC|nr:6-carboxytetrahydropterin synthase [Kaistella sp. Ran72]